MFYGRNETFVSIAFEESISLSKKREINNKNFFLGNVFSDIFVTYGFSAVGLLALKDAVIFILSCIVQTESG